MTALALALILFATPRGDEPRDALVVELARPDLQAEQLLKLFRGAKAPHAAAALAGWKRATGNSLPKATEALIAALNPDLAPELKSLHGGQLVLGVDPDSHAIRWQGWIPDDDGTFASVATALALTDGGPDEPIGTFSVDRLGPPGGPLMAVGPRGVALASSRAELSRAIASRPDVAFEPRGTGVLNFAFRPGNLGDLGSLRGRQVGAFLAGLGLSTIRGGAATGDDTLAIDWSGPAEGWPEKIGEAKIEFAWFDDFPADRTIAAAAVAIDPGSNSWDVLFRAVDRAIRADPAQAEAQPIRTRINVLALPLGISPESQIWPRLKGVAFGMLGTAERADGLRVALHATDEAAAERFERTVVPKLAARFGLDRVGENRLAVARRGTRILLSWEPPRDGPEGDGLAGVVRRLGGSPPHHAVVVQPSRVPGLVPTGSPAAEGLADASPLVLLGHTGEGQLRGQLRWDALDRPLRRFLDRLPMDLAPEPRR